MDHPLTQLEPLLGTWKTSGSTHDDPPQTLDAIDTYEKLGSGFIIHRVSGKLGESDLRSIEMIGYDPERKVFTMHSFDGSGTTEQMTATFESGHWKITGEKARFEGRLEKDRVTGTWERKTSGGWQPWMTIELTRRN